MMEDLRITLSNVNKKVHLHVVVVASLLSTLMCSLMFTHVVLLSAWFSIPTNLFRLAMMASTSSFKSCLA